MAQKPDEVHTDFEWYVVLLAACSIAIDGLDAGNYLFDLKTTDPMVHHHFNNKTPPHIAAIEMFSRRH